MSHGPGSRATRRAGPRPGVAGQRGAPVRHLGRAEQAGAQGLDGDPEEGAEHLLGSVGDWPLWPDVEAGLPALRDKGFRIGLLSNVDDAVFARTPAAQLVDPDAALTSERLRAYKPHREIYHRAREALPGMVHVATSARDVQGATEAGIPFVRLRRPGHRLTPGTPPPPHEVGSVLELADVVAAAGENTT